MKINNKGQALVEYVLIIALISVLAISLVSLLGGYLKDSMTKSSCEIVDKHKKKEKNQVKGFVLTNNKGQALVEFILIFPIIVLILCIIIDFSNVFVSENKLENKLDDVIYLIRNNKENDINNILDNNTKYSISKSGSYATVELTSKVKFITPFSNIFFKNDYNISTKRVILYE